MKKTLIALFATASVFAGVSAASAQTAPSSTGSNLTVRAKLTNGCSIEFLNGSQTVEFPAITDLNSDKHAGDQQFQIKCTNALKDIGGNADKNTYVPQYVALNAGDVPGSTVDNRLLGFADASTVSDTLQFQVYQGQPGSRVIWGDQEIAANAAPSSVKDAGYPIPDVNAVYHFQVDLLRRANNLDGLTAGTYQNVMVATVYYGPKSSS